MLQTLVKVSGINNLSDARYCAGMMVEWIGFNIDPTSSSHLGIKEFKEITDWVAGVKLVGEFSSAEASQILEMSAELNLDAIQFENPEQASTLKDSGKQLIFRLDLDTADPRQIDDLIEDMSETADYILIESSSDSASKLPEELLQSDGNMILGDGITEENVLELINEQSIQGIALKGGDEIKPGIKDFDELATILEKIETE